MDFSQYAYLSHDSETEYSDEDSSGEQESIQATARKEIQEIRSGIQQLLKTPAEGEETDKSKVEKGVEEDKEEVPFYDDKEDEDNQRWVDKNLR